MIEAPPEAPEAARENQSCSASLRQHRRSQRLAWWLVRAAKLSRTFRLCERCGGPVESSYNPNPRSGLELWTRCSTCGWSLLQLCQPHGERRPFIPPVPWTTVEEEIAAMRAAPIAE